MGNHFYGSYHWEFSPVEDRVLLLEALKVFCDEDANLFIESISPPILQRFAFWRMRSHYKVSLIPDALSPRPAIFHVALNAANLEKLKAIVKRDGLNERSFTHMKGYSGSRGLFWFHGFCDQGDRTLGCSQHVDDATIEALEARLGVKAEKKFGELKTDRQQMEEFSRIFDALLRQEHD